MTRQRVAMAEFVVARDPDELTTAGLGSCVAIALYDPQTRIGGLAHIVLPSPLLARDASNGAKFPDTVVPLMLEEMREMGAGRRVWAKIAGGARMFASLIPGGVSSMGERNVVATCQALERARVDIIGQDTGGDYGRSVYFDLASGDVTIRSVTAGEHVL